MSGRITIPAPDGSEGLARNAASCVPSAEVSTTSSCSTAAPASGGIGGAESKSKHMTGTLKEPGRAHATKR